MLKGVSTMALVAAAGLLSLPACNDAPVPPPPADADATLGACTADIGPDAGPCTPLLDHCAPGQIPLPGGGCKRIGVERCDGGLRGPPDWTCKPIGPPAKCLSGWERVERGWCEPILPDTSCPEGKMEVIGKRTCQPVGDCGSGTWGKLRPRIVALSRRHRVASEYTAYLVTETDADYLRPTSGQKWQRQVKRMGDDAPSPSSFHSTPEPHEVLLVGLGLLLLWAARRRGWIGAS